MNVKKKHGMILSMAIQTCKLPKLQWRGGRGWGAVALPSDNFLEALKSKGGAKIRNCQCEILYKICKVQLINKLKDGSNFGISIAIQLSNNFWE